MGDSRSGEARNEARSGKDRCREIRVSRPRQNHRHAGRQNRNTRDWHAGSGSQLRTGPRSREEKNAILGRVAARTCVGWLFEDVLLQASVWRASWLAPADLRAWAHGEAMLHCTIISIFGRESKAPCGCPKDCAKGEVERFIVFSFWRRVWQAPAW